MDTPMEQCQGPGRDGTQCAKQAQRDGLCHGHREQRYNEQPLSPLREQGQTRLQMLRAAALAYADAPAEDDKAFQRATKRLIMAARRYAGPRGNEFSGEPQDSAST